MRDRKKRQGQELKNTAFYLQPKKIYLMLEVKYQ